MYLTQPMLLHEVTLLLYQCSASVASGLSLRLVFEYFFK
jgi:hypothetical protein